MAFDTKRHSRESGHGMTAATARPANHSTRWSGGQVGHMWRAVRAARSHAILYLHDAGIVRDGGRSRPGDHLADDPGGLAVRSDEMGQPLDSLVAPDEA